ncbi:hypothetical protein B0H14DRAFT_2585601 [Mycena olivaceomarginata]|nr:hypothetical protein B0H14DRAFT_2585601 [Mycena olivaceomarginata]
MGYVTLYGPRQHPEEPVYAEQEPVHTYFRQQADRRLSRTQFKGFIDELVFILQSPQYEQKWEPIITNWVNYCLGIATLMLEPSTKLFVKVLWANNRFNLDADLHDPPLVLMEKAQNHAVQSPIVCHQVPTHPYIPFMERGIPRKINVMDASEDFSDDDDNISDYNDEYEDIKVGDPKNREEDKSEQGRKRRRTCEQNRLSGPKRAPTTRMNSRNKRDWNIELEDKGVLEYVVEKWVSDLDLHFGWRRGEDGESDPDAGAVLQQMNAVAPRIYEQEAFRQVVHSTEAGEPDHRINTNIRDTLRCK